MSVPKTESFHPDPEESSALGGGPCGSDRPGPIGSGDIDCPLADPVDKGESVRLMGGIEEPPVAAIVARTVARFCEPLG